MDKLNAGNRQLEASRVYKIRPGQELPAKAAAEKSGADDVFFRMGGDTFAATGRGMNLKGLKEGDTIEYKGQKGVIVSVDDRMNSAMDGLKAPYAQAMLGIGAATAGGGAVLGAAGVGTIAGSVFVGGLIAVAAGVGFVGSAAYGALRSVKADALQPYAE
ncbi:hypothetical protein J7643_15165 [bacterium]|nr:hypothetical protein [bacterium]